MEWRNSLDFLYTPINIHLSNKYKNIHLSRKYIFSKQKFFMFLYGKKKYFFTTANANKI